MDAAQTNLIGTAGRAGAAELTLTEFALTSNCERLMSRRSS